ncbi:MAG: bifunctional adenosylcobinamide kinase/adenosylcobinamide-phosphate guanylyltransferase [Paracoccaceae bacterium]
MSQKRITLVLGGAASGKSAFAERLVVATAKPRVYLATSQAFDDEMRAKVQAHLDQRGPDWLTVEVPMQAAQHLTGLGPEQVCLFDCATMWLTNQMLAESDLGAAQAALLQALRDCPAELVIVSNEVGHGIVPENALARRFREAQGRLNIELAQIADTVILVTAGLPQYLKGTP